MRSHGRKLAQGLERGFPPRSFLSKVTYACAAHFWSSSVFRPLALPPHVCSIGVGGATLGGSSKTPVAIALCRALSERCGPVALVEHAYGARPREARLVERTDSVHEVGDEALVAASALEGRALVVVGPSRQKAVGLASRHARVLVFDGLAQIRPARLTRSILALDAVAPWGAALVPPFGDLRAPPDKLLDVADVVAWVSDERDRGASGDARRNHDERSGHGLHGDEEGGRHGLCGEGDPILPCRPEVPVVPVTWSLRVDTGQRSPSAVEDLRGMRLGLLLGLARPDRILRALRLRGVDPDVRLLFADHAIPSASFMQKAARAAESFRLEAWLATSKCKTRLPPRVGRAPVLELRQELALSESAFDVLVGRRCELPTPWSGSLSD